VFVAVGALRVMRMRHIFICANDHHAEANDCFDNRNQFYQRADETYRRVSPWLKAILNHAIPDKHFYNAK